MAEAEFNQREGLKMFKEIQCKQNSDEWFAARLGLFTASSFDKILTTTGRPSTSQKVLINKKVAELVIGKPEETYQNEAMQRGQEIEPEALEFVNFTLEKNFKPCGFLDSEKGWGCSPDALNSEQGLEIKCPLAHTQIECLANNKLPSKYFAQVQGSMFVTGFKSWIFCSYHPELPSLILKIERDDEFISKLQKELLKMVTERDNKLKIIKEMI
mgnify:CR=1 FL=1